MKKLMGIATHEDSISNEGPQLLLLSLVHLCLRGYMCIALPFPPPSRPSLNVILPFLLFVILQAGPNVAVGSIEGRCAFLNFDV